ncbi:MAG: hypothetical protein HY530_01140 [Chloroflexi bacterium]|nr:hypothetical protein [Chloroflexota bacterium]
MRRVISVFLGLMLSLLAIGAGCARAPAPTVTVPAPTVTAPGPTVTVTAPAPTPTPTPTPAPESAAEFYKNKTVTIIVPWGAGGGIDYAARAFASFWSDVTGGAMVVKNVVGGGGLLGLNQLYKTAKPDGLTLGVNTVGANNMPWLLKDPGVEYEIDKFLYIGQITKEPRVLVVGSKLPQSMAELQKLGGLKFGSFGGSTDAATQGMALIIELFGLKDAKIVGGMGSAADIVLAIGRGEIAGYTTPVGTAVMQLATGFISPPPVVVDFVRSKWVPDSPALVELVKLSPEQETLLKLYVGVGEGGKIMFTPPGVPEDRIKFLREAFAKVVALPGLKSLTKDVWKGYEQVSGEEYTAVINAVKTFPKTYTDMLLAITNKYVALQ